MEIEGVRNVCGNDEVLEDGFRSACEYQMGASYWENKCGQCVSWLGIGVEFGIWICMSRCGKDVTTRVSRF